ncbi:MAG: hypothetical protein AAF713_01840 [Pseudomonadota bacterium]
MGRAVGYDTDLKRFEPGSPAVAGALDEVAEIWVAYRPDLGTQGILVSTQ